MDDSLSEQNTMLGMSVTNATIKYNRPSRSNRSMIGSLFDVLESWTCLTKINARLAPFSKSVGVQLDTRRSAETGPWSISPA